MPQELDILGVCVPPFVGHLVAALLLFLGCRWLLARSGLLARLWQPALVELSLFVVLLSAMAYR